MILKKKNYVTYKQNEVSLVWDTLNFSLTIHYS